VPTATGGRTPPPRTERGRRRAPAAAYGDPVTRRGLSLVVTTVLAVLLVAVGTALPVPYVAISPGPVSDTLGEAGGSPLIEVEGVPTHPTSGELNLTTVAVTSRISLPQAVRGWFDDRVAVVPREQVFPPGRSTEQVEADNEAAFTASQVNATAAALEQLGVPYEAVPGVGQVSPGAPADGRLEPGDALLSVDGQPVTDVAEIARLVREREAGDEVVLRYRRDGAEEEVTLTTVPAEDGRPVIGVVPGVVDLDYAFEVRISLDEVGGPSAGLMFALGIVDKLTPEPLADGRTVAGTGSIDASGGVGPIGGIRQKLIAAREIGASVFLVPADNCREAAGQAPEGLELVRVETLAGAVEGLTALSEGREPPRCTA